jgi:hypothetical protein
MSRALNLYCISPFLLAVSSFIVTQQSLANTSLDLVDSMSERYERDCAVRNALDLYSVNGHVAAILADNVLKQRETQIGLQTVQSLNLKRVYYRNIPVAKIDYVIHSHSRQLQQIIYLDLTSVTAKQNYSDIEFRNRGHFSVSKEGRFTALSCRW